MYKLPYLFCLLTPRSVLRYQVYRKYNPTAIQDLNGPTGTAGIVTSMS